MEIYKACSIFYSLVNICSILLIVIHKKSNKVDLFNLKLLMSSTTHHVITYINTFTDQQIKELK